MTTRTECANLLRSFGVSVHEVKNEGKYGILRCHVDYIQGTPLLIAVELPTLSTY